MDITGGSNRRAMTETAGRSPVNYPLRHVSIRVPWHDTGWDGRVCAEPMLNGSCLRLKGIGQNRDDDAEREVAGQSLEVLPSEKWPCCVSERAMFMAPFPLMQQKVHPYSWDKEGPHAHFASTPLRLPSYSAPAVPFSWMLTESMEQYAVEHELDVRPEREPELSFSTPWIQERQNQLALLDCFADHIKPDQSLVFFYAKHVPFVEDSNGRRIIIGVGRVQHVAPSVEYKYDTTNLDGKLRAMLWERVIQHSIRPDFKDGFLLPYHAAVEKAAIDPDFDAACIAAFSPDDRFSEFSHASQLVTHDAAISALLACSDAIQVASPLFPGRWDQVLQWIDARLGELWRMRGPCPGLGAALSAFGIEQGHFIAHAIAADLDENADPWPMVDQIFGDPKAHLPDSLARRVGKTLAQKWKALPAERRALLQLISRFEVSQDQAKLLYVQEERRAANIGCSDADILANPYLLYELTRFTADPVSVWTVDRGVFPDDVVRDAHPLPEPSALDGGADARRVRALTISTLEHAAASGSSLLPQDQVVMRIRDLPLSPSCEVDADLIAVAKSGFGNEIIDVPMADNAPALQLGRLVEMREVIRSAVTKRANGKRLQVTADWRGLLDEHLGSEVGDDELEEQARVEKTAALVELAESRISVLIGPAGTGKTTLLSVLCGHPDIAAGDVLLLAPTGKARVRMEQSTKGLNLKGYTIAQFLSPHRYDGSTGRYMLSDRKPEDTARTVVIDEASMLTEEMLAALLQAFRGVHRLILIGDPRQLPPIGTGRPFVDIVRHLAPEGVTEMFPRIGKGYAELTIRRRQAGEEREDLQLAEWFSGAPIAPGEDEVFDTVVAAGSSKHVRFIEWKTAEELRAAVLETVVAELGLSGADDIAGFDERLGASFWNELPFFNPRRNSEEPGAAEISERWQILSPVRSGAHGVPDLNRLIHETFRTPMIESSSKRGHQTPKPKGPEKVVYGDKVINLVNTDPSHFRYRHRKVFPAKDNAYIANGEIGMAVGFFWKGRSQKTKFFRENLDVEFSSQPGTKFTFTDRDFGEEGNPVLELAYALTVHKSQGSEFGTVILVLPSPCRLLSREMLYTAMTRQRDRILILHQGQRSDLRKYSSDDRSETACRLTNIFEAPHPIEIDGRFYEEGLIHRTSKGEMVRSKSEVIIAEHLAARDVEYSYERALTINGTTKYPDFTIEDMESGLTIYWEHCGMLHVPSYRRRWEGKLEWYKANGILPHDEGGGPNGTLVITRDDAKGGIDSKQITQLLDDVL